jgi:hypothetical protein
MHAGYAQAWVPARRTGTVTIVYNNIYVKDHTTATGERVDFGQIRQNSVSLGVDYGLTRRVALSLEVPFIWAKYNGAFPHLDEGEPNIDDGNYHGGSQDLHFGARYALMRDAPVLMAPFVEGVLPTRDYPIFGHSMIGRDLRELIVGTNLAADLSRLAPNTYIQARLSYALVNDVQDRMNGDASVGYRLTGRTIVSGIASFQKHTGGLTFVPGHAFDEEHWIHHGQLMRNDSLEVGAGVSFSVNPSTHVFGTFLRTVWSRNAHAIDSGLSGGISFAFDTR